VQIIHNNLRLLGPANPDRVNSLTVGVHPILEAATMKKTYVKPVLIKRQQLAIITGASPSAIARIDRK
jgi:hypothetical protein